MRNPFQFMSGMTPEMIEAIRQANIAPPPVAVEEPEPEYRMISPEGVQFDRPAFEGYQQHLASMPDRESLRPSFGRKLLAGLVGAADTFATGSPGRGVETAERLRDARYDTALGDWARQGAALKEGSEAEALDERLLLQRIKAMNDATYKEGQIDIGNRRADAYAEGKEAQGQYWRDTVDINRDRAENQGAYWDSMAGSSARRAAAAERSAGAAVDRTRHYGRRVDNLNSRPDRPASTSRGPAPASQQKAREMAISDALISHPDWAQFVDRENGVLIPPTDGLFTRNFADKKKKYKAFLAYIKKRESDRLGGFTVPDVPEFEDEDEEEEEEDD